MGDFNPDNYKDRFVGDLVGFVAGEGFQSLFERFFLTYAPEFSYEQEHKLRYYELYQEFQGLFEEQLERFQKQLNLSPAQFFQRCRESSEEDEKCKKYIGNCNCNYNFNKIIWNMACAHMHLFRIFFRVVFLLEIFLHTI